MNANGDVYDFEKFAVDIRPRLIRAFVGFCGVDGAADAASEALVYAFENWDRIGPMDNPGGYLYRVGQSRTRRRVSPSLPAPGEVGLPRLEPGLVPALMALPLSQRTAVWLVHACGWPYSEVAAAMDTSVSMVGNHVGRGLKALRRQLGVESHV